MGEYALVHTFQTSKRRAPRYIEVFMLEPRANAPYRG